MRRPRFSVHHKFLALRACWTILRGGAVAYKLNLTEGGFNSLSAPTFVADCQMDGEPMTPWDLEHGHPEPQPE